MNLNDSGVNEQDQILPTDVLETLSAAHPDVDDVPSDSPTSEFDAGLDDVALGEAEIGSDTGIGTDFPTPGEVSEDDAGVSRREIPMTDLPGAPREDFVHVPEMSDMNVPGEIDIEDLDEEAIEDALPPDARLDPLED
jgi:hypothetical protein